MHSESPGWLNKALFNASYGLHSLDPSCQTMSLALCKAHNQKHLLLVEWKQSLEEQLRVNFYHIIFNIGRAIDLYDNDYAFLSVFEIKRWPLISSKFWKNKLESIPSIKSK